MSDQDRHEVSAAPSHSDRGILPPDLDAALYAELLPVRPSGKPDTFLGPTHQWALHLERLELDGIDWPLTIVDEVA